jgi:hypothetical protein
MRRHIIYCLAVALMAALVLPLLSMSSSSADDSFYVSNQSRNASGLLTGTVSKFNANNGRECSSPLRPGAPPGATSLLTALSSIV